MDITGKEVLKKKKYIIRQERLTVIGTRVETRRHVIMFLNLLPFNTVHEQRQAEQLVYIYLLRTSRKLL